MDIYARADQQHRTTTTAAANSIEITYVMYQVNDVRDSAITVDTSHSRDQLTVPRGSTISLFY